MTGLILQLAIGPVFFFIMNLAIQKSIFDGLAGALAVTLVDYFYIALSILGIGKLLENKKYKKYFGTISSLVLSVFGLLIIRDALFMQTNSAQIVDITNIFSSFISVLLMTVSSPMTIVFFTSLFSAKANEYNFSKNELILFGLGTGFATLLFMGTSAVFFSIIKGIIPTVVIQVLNILVGCILAGYGGLRIVKNINNR
jgi:threonine/homoserine/homoserine lactone efflux protein